MSTTEVVGLGALNIDHLYRVERILGDGEAVANNANSVPGGSAANTIFGLAKLGVKTGFIGMVGDDAEGKMLVQDFQKVGVDTSQIRVKSGAETGSVLCLSDRHGRRSLYVMPGVNSLLTIDDLDFTYIRRAGMLHISSFADDRQFQILLEMISGLAPSTKVSFAPGALFASKGLKALTPILSKTYVLFINQAELSQLTGKDTAAGAKSLLGLNCHIVVVTLGRGTKLKVGKGIRQRAVNAVCYITDAEHEFTLEPTNQSVGLEVGATGAGDAFATGFLYGLLKEKGLEECGRLGDIAASFSLTGLGAREGLPTLNKLAQRYQELYNKAL